MYDKLLMNGGSTVDDGPTGSVTKLAVYKMLSTEAGSGLRAGLKGSACLSLGVGRWMWKE